MSNLIRLIGRRLVALPIMILGVALLVFVVMSFSPIDPARLALGESASPEAIDAYRERNGLNDPLGVRYFTFVCACRARGHGGDLRDQKVTDVVMHVPITYG